MSDRCGYCRDERATWSALTQSRIQRFTKFVAYNLARIGIGNQHQVSKLAACTDIGDVAHPKLFSTVNFQFGGKIGMFLEPMPAIGSRSVLFATPDQQFIAAQEGKN